LIDLHTHTTASDGLLSPSELVARAGAAGVDVLGVTDHDTVAGCADAAEACRHRGVTFVPGIELTAVRAAADVHILGYFVDPGSATLEMFLAGQRRMRIDRVLAMIERLRSLGFDLDAEAIVRPAIENPATSIGRPSIARALIDAGYVENAGEAFDRLLMRGRPAFVPRTGAGPERVIACIHDAGGLASLAHPGLVGHDEWIPELAVAGIDALEAYHSDHDASATARYAALARQHRLLVTGGSDFHGDPTHGPAAPGDVSLPAEEFERLRLRQSRVRRTKSTC